MQTVRQYDFPDPTTGIRTEELDLVARLSHRGQPRCAILAAELDVTGVGAHATRCRMECVAFLAPESPTLD
jgi:hypothetical protein